MSIINNLFSGQGKHFNCDDVIRFKKKKNVNALIRALGYKKNFIREGNNTDDSEKVRAYAATALGDIGDLKALKFIDEAMSDSSEYVRNNATRAWYILRKKEMEDLPVEELIKYLTDKDKDEQFREAAARILGKKNDLNAINSLIDVMMHDESNGVRFRAIESLGNLGSIKAFDSLKFMSKIGSWIFETKWEDTEGFAIQKRAKELGIKPFKGEVFLKEICGEAIGKIRQKEIPPLFEKARQKDKSAIGSLVLLGEENESLRDQIGEQLSKIGQIATEAIFEHDLKSRSFAYAHYIKWLDSDMINLALNKCTSLLEDERELAFHMLYDLEAEAGPSHKNFRQYLDPFIYNYNKEFSPEVRKGAIKIMYKMIGHINFQSRRDDGYWAVKNLERLAKKDPDDKIREYAKELWDEYNSY